MNDVLKRSASPDLPDRAVPQRHTDPVFVALRIDREFPGVFPVPAIHPFVCEGGISLQDRIGKSLQPGPAEGEADGHLFMNIYAVKQHTPEDLLQDIVFNLSVHRLIKGEYRQAALIL